MAKTQFINHLRTASRMMQPSQATGPGAEGEPRHAYIIDAADLWLTPKAVEGFEPSDFADLAQEDRMQLANAVAAFRAIAKNVKPDVPAKTDEAAQARQHLGAVLNIVSKYVLANWMKAEGQLMKEAKEAAQERGWETSVEEKELSESLLGKYKVPRLRIKTEKNKEVVLDPIAYFGSGRQAVVDLALMPTFETERMIVFKDGKWQITTAKKNVPFDRQTLINTITHLTEG